MDLEKRFNESCTENPVAVSKSIEKIIDDSQYTGELLLSGKKLTDLPASIINYDLSDLYHVDLSRNTLNESPLFLSNFLSLEHLDCHHNFVRFIPDSISRLAHLVVLDFSHNLLTSFPPCACQLQCLQVLALSNNKIPSLPEEIGNLKSLMKLDMSRNMLSELPDTVGRLHSLRSLDVHQNQLTSLSQELTNLRLEKLDVSINKISQIPLDLHRMVTLDDLNICNNPLLVPPQHVVVKGRQHVMAYLALERFRAGREAKKQVVHSNRKLTKSGLSSSSIVLRSFSQDMTAQPGRLMGRGTSRGQDPHDENRKMLPCLSVDALFSRSRADDISVDGSLEGPESVDSRSRSDVDDDVGDSLPSSPRSFASTETLSCRESPRKISDAPSSNEVDAADAKRSAQKIRANGSRGSRKNLFDIGFIVNPKRSEGDSGDRDSSEVDKDGGEGTEFYKKYSTLVVQRKHEAARVKKLLVEDDSMEARSDSNGKESSLSPRCMKMLESMAEQLSEHDPVLTIRRNIQHVASERVQSVRLKRMLETLLKTEVREDVGDTLRDGVLLCRLANLILPNSVPHVHTPDADNKLSEAKCRKNVENFLVVCRRVGLDKEQAVRWQNLLTSEHLNDDTSLTIYTQEALRRLPPKRQSVELTTSRRRPLTFPPSPPSPSPEDRMIATFCIFFFISTCLCLYWCPVPS